MARKDRTLLPEVDEAIRDARVAGLSERAIYESLRDNLAEVPSYRDVRASLARQGLRYKEEATAERSRLRADRLKVAKEYHEGPNDPRLKTYAQRRAEALSVDERPEARDSFDRKFMLGYLARAGVDPDDIEDESFRESLISIYQGDGS